MHRYTRRVFSRNLFFKTHVCFFKKFSQVKPASKHWADWAIHDAAPAQAPRLLERRQRDVRCLERSASCLFLKTTIAFLQTSDFTQIAALPQRLLLIRLWLCMAILPKLSSMLSSSPTGRGGFLQFIQLF